MGNGKPQPAALGGACGIAAGSFSLLFGGGVGTFIVAFLIGMLAQVVQPYLSDRLTLQLSYIGSVLIFVVGFNLVFSDRKMKVANMLPALLIPVAWECIQLLL